MSIEQTVAKSYLDEVKDKVIEDGKNNPDFDDAKYGEAVGEKLSAELMSTIRSLTLLKAVHEANSQDAVGLGDAQGSPSNEQLKIAADYTSKHKVLTERLEEILSAVRTQFL